MDEHTDPPRSEPALTRALQMMSLAGLTVGDFRASAVLGAGSTVMRLVTLLLFLPLVFGLLGGDFSRLDRLLPLSAVFDTGNSKSLVWVLGGAIVVAALVSAAFDYVGQLVVVRNSERARLRLSRKLISAYFSYGQQYFDLERFASVVAKTSKLPALGRNYFRFLNALFVGSLALVAYLLVMAWMSPLLTVIVLVALFGYLYGFNQITRRIESLDERVSEAEDEVSGVATEYIVNLPLVRLFGAEDKALDVYESAQSKAHDSRVEGSQTEAIITPLRNLSSILVLVAFAVIAGQLGDRFNVAMVSSYVVYFLLLRRAMNHFSMILSAPMRWRKLSERFDKLFQLLDPEDKFVVPSGSHPYAGLGEGMEFRHLDFSYQRKGQVLIDVSLRIPAGRRTVIVGATGSGKSTLFHLLLRRYDCPPDSIFVAGRDIRELDSRQWLEHVAYADAHPMFLNDTIRNNLTVGREVDDGAVRSAAEQCLAWDFIHGLPDRLDQQIGDRGTLLSTGEQQRLALARIFLGDPELILLDEATSALDPSTEEQVMKSIDEFATGRTLVMVAHRMATLRKSDHVVVMRRGRVVEQGARDSLLGAGGELERLWAVDHRSD